MQIIIFIVSFVIGLYLGTVLQAWWMSEGFDLYLKWQEFKKAEKRNNKNEKGD
jgi:uncharacterized membrane protein